MGNFEDDTKEMTNDEYREALQEIFLNEVHENYKLKWFYNFITAKIEYTKSERKTV